MIDYRSFGGGGGLGASIERDIRRPSDGSDTRLLSAHSDTESRQNISTTITDPPQSAVTAHFGPETLRT